MFPVVVASCNFSKVVPMMTLESLTQHRLSQNLEGHRRSHHHCLQHAVYSSLSSLSYPSPSLAAAVLLRDLSKEPQWELRYVEFQMSRVLSPLSVISPRLIAIQ